MNIGYVKEFCLLKDDIVYENKKKQLNVDMVYVDRHGEKVAFQDMLKYVRSGDIIVAQSVMDISSTVGEFMELAIELMNKHIYIKCKAQGIDTSMLPWRMIWEALSVFEHKEKYTNRGRIPRIVEDLDTCFEMVEAKDMTVKEVCEKLNISKSMYYRRWRQKYDMKPKENHIELFDDYETLVKNGEITVVEACRQMNISVATYYRKRKNSML